MSHTSQTICRNCPSLCGLLVETEGNKVLSIRGDKKSPLTSGYFCPKGSASMELHNGEDRLLSSAARDHRGKLANMPVEQALDRIHGELERIIRRYGPGAVAMYYGTGVNNHSLGHSAMKAWFHLIGSPYVFSSMTVDQSAKWVACGRLGTFATGKYDIGSADVLMVVGANPAVSHVGGYPISNPSNSIRQARKRGLKLIVVDPRLSETARFADLHLQIRPGEDATLFASLIKLVLEKGTFDRDFCARFAVGLDDLRRSVAPFDLAYAADRCGLSIEKIEQAADLFCSGRRKSAFSGTGPDMSTDSNLAEHLIETFNAICGGYRRAGDRIGNTGPLFGGVPTQEQVFPPHRSWETGPKCKTADIGPMYGEYSSGLLPDEIFGDGENKIRALLVVGGNPAKAIGDPDKTLSALKSLDLLVTLDFRPTETTALSHYVVATSLPYERHDFTGIYDPLLSVPFAHVAVPILCRPPNVIDDWEAFWGLAKRMGKTLTLKRPLFGASHSQIPGPELELDVSTKPNTADIIRWMTSQGATNYDELLSRPEGIIVKSCQGQVTPATVDDGARLNLCPADVISDLTDLRRSGDDEHASDYPFRLVVRRMLEAMNSAYNNATRTRRRNPVNSAFMNVLDMKALSIEDGDSIEIASPYGMVVGRAKADSGLRQGVVSMTHGWGSPDASNDADGTRGAFSGRLVSLVKDRQSISWMPRQSAIPVRITRRERPPAEVSSNQ